MNAVHAMPAASRTWHQPSASRAVRVPCIERRIHEPAELPIARPMRKTARIIEKT